MADKREGPFLGVPEGGVKHDEPDGVTLVDGFNSLRDGGDRPPIQSGDWQHRPPGSPARRGRTGTV